MKIRAITLFAEVGPPLDEAQVARLGEFVRVARRAYEEDGFVVQTTRLATRVSPFDFAYFTDSRVLSLGDKGAQSLLTRTTELNLSPRL